uniref:Uncharacterized protein n=1 Tax=Cannabis sativa TaxID=3483 RepID=A0A803R8I6_CANSA
MPPSDLNFTVTAPFVRRRQQSNDYISESTNDKLVSFFWIQSEKTQEKFMKVLQVGSPIHQNIPSFHHFLHRTPKVNKRVNRIFRDLDAAGELGRRRVSFCGGHWP